MAFWTPPKWVARRHAGGRNFLARSWSQVANRMSMTPRALLILSSAVALSAGAGAAARAQDGGGNGYVWHTANENESAQYGIPDSDDRALRLDCEPSGMISIMGPTAAETEGQKVQVVLQGKTGRRTLPGIVIALGDGNNFSVEVEPTDDAVATLMAGHDLTVGSAGDEWTVPGKGAARALAPVLKTCAGR